MPYRLSAVMICLLVAASTLAAWAAPASVDLALKGAPGQADKYVSTLDFTMDFQVAPPGGGVSLSVTPRFTGTFTTIQHVRAVAPNGDLTLGLQIESFDAALDAADLHLRLAICGPNGGPPTLIKLPPLPLETVITKRGKPVTIKGLDQLPIPPIPGPDGKPLDLMGMMNKMMSDFSQPLFPNRPVKLGDKWEWEMTMDPMAMMEDLGMPMPAEAKSSMPDLKIPIRNTSTLVAFETVGGVECAKIEAVAPWQLEMPAGPPAPGGMVLKEQGKTSVTTWFDYSAGRKVRETFRVEVTMTMGDGKTAPVRMTMLGTGVTELKQ